MTRPSKRELRRALAALGDDRDDGPNPEIHLRERVVSTDWGDSDAAPGEIIDEQETVIHP
jgi:hypothetical protein